MNDTGIRYSVEVAFLSTGSISSPLASVSSSIVGINAKTKDWNKSLLSGVSGFASSFNSALDSIGSTLAGIGETALTIGISAAALGMGALVKKGFEFNDTMEQTQISFAAMANANGLIANMHQGMELSRSVMQDMRVDAAALPGEFKDLSKIMGEIMPMGAQHGMDIHQIEKLSAQAMSAGAALSVDFGDVGSAMRMMMAGKVRSNNPFFGKGGFHGEGGAPGSATEFNKLSYDKRMEAIHKIVDKLSESMEYSANSWRGLMTTITDKMRQGAGAIMMPLFNTAKGMMKSLGNWVGDNQLKLFSMAETFGLKLKDGFLRAIEIVQEWYPVVETFVETMYNGIKGVFDRMSPFIHEAFGWLKDFLTDPKAFDRIEKMLASAAALRVGGAVVSGGLGLLKEGSSLAALGGTDTVAAFSGALKTAIPLIGLLGIAAEGAAHATLDKTSPGHKMALDMVNQIKDSIRPGTGMGAARDVVDLTGVGLLGATALAIRGLNGVIDSLAGGFRIITESIQEASAALRGDFSVALKHHAFNTAMLNAPQPIEIDRNQEIRMTHALVGHAEPNMGHGKFYEPPKSVTNIHQVNINVNGNEDPNRVARKTVDMVNDLARHPKIAALSGNPWLATR